MPTKTEQELKKEERRKEIVQYVAMGLEIALQHIDLVIASNDLETLLDSIEEMDKFYRERTSKLHALTPVFGTTTKANQAETEETVLSSYLAMILGRIEQRQVVEKEHNHKNILDELSKSIL